MTEPIMPTLIPWPTVGPASVVVSATSVAYVTQCAAGKRMKSAHTATLIIRKTRQVSYVIRAEMARVSEVVIEHLRASCATQASVKALAMRRMSTLVAHGVMAVCEVADICHRVFRPGTATEAPGDPCTTEPRLRTIA